ncbi:nitrate- and nitrite sensing domain-containing protein [Streptomyces sp. H10-C2]|uniref:sensor histidine kinase n=1 Tax=unclassified Streptomyces TaxID=2593676 RepID=UPI0024BB87D4|nr:MULTISPECIES: nitrate- and nitrite sensing domain-containing protein [unclassified Streptomyces]MDJ0341671.1 nitrate- and nitrite sensing domain-containing protein [Streptomyces sp. PH10-H1]MDJ0369021.1 nitrate- and nitrite sensing domain-containing protein [Streptomyces sp. H10-C2]
MQGRFKRDSGAAGDPEQPGGANSGPSPQRSDDAVNTAAAGRSTTHSGIDAGRITGGVGKPGPRIAMRNWRISTRLISLLALPVVAATSLGALRISSSLDNITQLEHMKQLTQITEHATDLAGALQEERDRSAGPMSSGTGKSDDAVGASREATDRFRKLFQSTTDDVDPNDQVFVGVRSTLLAIEQQLGGINEIRDQAYTQPQYIALTVNKYDSLIQSLLSLSQDMAQATSNQEMIRSTRALAAFSSAKEFESIQRAVISAALAPQAGASLSENDWQYAKAAAQSEKTALTRFGKIYGGADAVELMAPLEGGNDTIKNHDTNATRILNSQHGIDTFAATGATYRDWDDAARSKIQAMTNIERSLLNEMQQQALKLRGEAQRQAIIDGAIILIVLGVAVVGAFIVARSMIRSLRRLQDTAQDVAQKRLPELVKQLSESDPQDVDTSVVSIGIHSRDEIGQVARAFDEVHSEAVRLAAEQALLRGNVNAMFTNLSRRSQGLIQRQLSLISELESREADPDQLSSLFKLDHLATRMRRNGENLLVLAGEEPGRRWTRPVPLVDVLRAAASEVEQYERIELTSVPAAEVTGRIVNDLVHLLAELLENATSFSSPQTKVKVTGHALPDGRVLIEIHDTGIGLSPEDLSDINERLANPPTVDVSVSRRMGLFVVGRLSLRHGIRIQLRPSDSGGTTALVMLPVDVTQGGQNAKNAAAGKRGPIATGMPGTPNGPGASATNAFGAAAGPAGQVGRPPQRGQVAGTGPRPALNSGPAGGPGGPGAPGSGARRAGGAPQNGQPQGQPQPSGPSWAQGDGQPQQGQPQRGGPPQGFPPPPPGGSGDRSPSQDTPRGHEDVESTARFERPDFDGPPPGGRPVSPQPRGDYQRPNAGPGAGSRQDAGLPLGDPFAPSPNHYPAPTAQDAGPGGFRSDVFGGAQGPNPVRGGARPDAHQPGSPSGEFPRPGNPGNSGTGEFPLPGGPQSGPRGSDYPNGSDTGQFPVPGTPPVNGRPQAEPYPGQRVPSQDRQGLPQRGGSPADGGFAGNQSGPQGQPGQPQGYPQQGNQQQGFQQQANRQPNRGTEPQLPPVSEPMALPPAPSRGDEPTPIFAAIESDWFRTGQAERMQQVHVESAAAAPAAPAAPARPAAPQPRPAAQPSQPQQPLPVQQQPQRARAEQPAPAPSAAPQRPAAPAQPTQPMPRETPNWRTSPNDELRQRAEQVREPSAGGVTPSGLPRRVPKANLVAGGATPQAAPQGGPQVSRAPDDVRGRLTNLRRGIQQGREAGNGNTDGRGFGTNNQER